MQLHIDYFRGVAMAMRRLRKEGKPLVFDGWSVCGSGHFSYVFDNAKFPDVVVKLSGRGKYSHGAKRDETWTAHGGIMDDMWPAYARLCQKYQGVHNVPVIHHVEQIGEAVHWAVVGKLKRSYNAKANGLGKYGTVHEGIIHMDNNNMCEKIDLLDYLATTKAPNSIREIDFLMEFMDLVVDHGARIDYHDDNYMEDSNGMTVATDPICGQCA